MKVYGQEVWIKGRSQLIFSTIAFPGDDLKATVIDCKKYRQVSQHRTLECLKFSLYYFFEAIKCILE